MKVISLFTLFLSLQASANVLQQCAVDLCGSPATLNTPYLTPDNISQYVSPEALTRLPEVKELAAKALKGLESRTKALIDRAEKTNVKRELSKWDANTWTNFKNNIRWRNEDVFEEAGGEGPCTKACQKRLETFITRELLAGIPQLKAQLAAPDRESFLWNCQASYASNFTVVSSTETEKMIPEIEADLVELVHQTFGSAAADSFRKFLDEKVTYDSGNPEDNSEHFLSYLRRFTEEAPVSGSLEGFLNELSGYVMVESGSFNLFNPIGACARPSSVSGDSYDENDNVVALSPFTLMNPVEGKSTIAHELGHALSDAAFNDGLGTAASKKMREIRQCVNASISSEEEPADIPQSWDGDLMITEEDFSDLIARRLYPQNAVKDTCALMKTDAGKTKYLEASLDRERFDGHSSALLRVIRAHHASGAALPASCQRALAARKDISLKQCL